MLVVGDVGASSAASGPSGAFDGSLSCTCEETHMEPENEPTWKTICIYKPVVFKFHVNFPECIHGFHGLAFGLEQVVGPCWTLKALTWTRNRDGNT